MLKFFAKIVQGFQLLDMFTKLLYHRCLIGPKAVSGSAKLRHTEKVDSANLTYIYTKFSHKDVEKRGPGLETDYIELNETADSAC